MTASSGFEELGPVGQMEIKYDDRRRGRRTLGQPWRIQILCLLSLPVLDPRMKEWDAPWCVIVNVRGGWVRLTMEAIKIVIRLNSPQSMLLSQQSACVLGGHAETI